LLLTVEQESYTIFYRKWIGMRWRPRHWNDVRLRRARPPEGRSASKSCRSCARTSSPEPELCEAFGVSRTPLRDALKILETEGLVRLLPHVGATVTPLDPPDLSDKLEVMTGLEQVAASGVAIRQDPAVVRRIHGLHQSMMDAARQNQVHRYYGLNDEFHAAIVRSNRNDTLSRLHETMMWHVFRARRRVNEAVPLAPDAARHHEGIVSAIFAADPDAASLAMRHHLGEVARSVLAGLDGLDNRPLPLHVI
jgi:DNA-binding GntR family transcriptional regulator